MLDGVTFTSITQNGNKNWTFQWQDQGAPYYRVVLQGKEISRITGTSYVFAGTGYTASPPPLEIMPGDVSALSEQWKPFMTIQWYGESCDYYTVEEFAGGDWVEKARIPETGAQVYTVNTPILGDGETHQYGVFSSSQGLSSTIQQFLFTVICLPTVGSVQVDYDNTNQQITIGS